MTVIRRVWFCLFVLSLILVSFCLFAQSVRITPVLNQAVHAVVLISPEKKQSMYFKSSAGAGVIVSKNGDIITCAHVVKDQNKVYVELYDARRVVGVVVAKDANLDLALVKINLADLQPIQWGKNEKVKIGETAYAIGNPHNQGFTVTKGIVSSLNRSMLAINQYESFIQFDAAISPGNSGGPLINAKGELLGIVAAVVQKNVSSPLGYAIPLYIVKNAYTQLKRYKKVVRGSLDLDLQSMHPAIAKRNHLPDYAGVLVVKVNGSSISRLLKRRDIIVAVNGTKVSNTRNFTSAIETRPPGSMVTLTVIRAKKRMSVQVPIQVKAPEDDLISDSDDMNMNSDFAPDAR